MPSRKIEPGSVNASLPVAIVFNAAGASMMNGSQRGPAKTRTPPADPSFLVDPHRHRLTGRGGAGDHLVDPLIGGAARTGAEKTQSKTSSGLPSHERHRTVAAPAVSGRRRKR